MKKLFFTALVAVAAIGGATAQYYSLGSVDQDIDCIGESGDCAAQWQTNTAYLVPADSPGNPGSQTLQPVTLIGKFYNPL